MKKQFAFNIFSITLSVLIAASVAQAEKQSTKLPSKLSCTIHHGVQKSSVVLSLDDVAEMEEGITSEYVEDLNFFLSASCEKNECRAALIINSLIVEGELALDGFEFDKIKKQTVFNEDLIDAPDRQEYLLTCKSL